MTTPILKIENLCKNFEEVKVLRDINVSIDKGEFLVLVGPSGCGKSTLLNCIAGLEEVTSGQLIINQKKMNDVPPKDRDIAMVFQSYALYPNMTVGENITFGMKIRHVEPAIRAEKLQEVAGLLQIGELLDRKPAQLSGGQRQRVAMGRALVRDPVLFLFDEPLSNLDAKLRLEMRSEIRHLHRTLKSSIVYVTHDQIEALTLATKIVVMHGGVIQQVGTPSEVYDHPVNTFVATFMGSPAMNLIPATIMRKGSGTGVSIKRPGQDAVVLDLTGTFGASVADGAPVLIGLRPEDITNAGNDDGPEVRTLTGTVSEVEPAGSDLFVSTELGGTSVTSRMRAHTPITIGDETPFSLDMSKVSFFDPASGARMAFD